MFLNGSTMLRHNEIENCLAKSDGTNIGQHNKSLYEQLEILNEILKKNISNSQQFWEEILDLLKTSIKYHDYGKANSEFQKKIQGKSHEEKLLHHLISPIFYLLDRNPYIKEEDKLILYSIVHHHSRQLELLESLKVDFMNNQLRKLLIEIKTSLIGVNQHDDMYNDIINKFLNIVFRFQKLDKKKAILLSGLLIRLDHAASGELDVEEEPVKEDRKTLLTKYLQKTGKSANLRPFQEKFGINQKKDHQCIVADTGLGKTGLSVLWIKRKKFYVLPNRASVNAMYKTLSEIYGEDKVGLLHSTALFNLIDQSENDDISIIKDYEQTRVLSKPVTVCTADQLFTAAFNMPGYEKIYATLAYSDVIIDEIQGFQPQQIVPILKQIRETKELGTRYLIITATLPDIVARKLQEIGFEVVINDEDTIDKVKRHKIKLEDRKIEDLIDDIYFKYQQNRKVLVVTNTVKKSQGVYEKLKDRFNGKIKDLHLLHRRFIWKDRQEKERVILEECKQDYNCNYKNSKGCIWVATQLVEASLDIDFDYLFTEASTADSLIQRMGRVWRHRKSDYSGEENIIIACDVEYRIYEENLTKKSLEMIKAKLQNGYLFSRDKREIVKKIYSEENLKDSKYLKEWEKFENQINSGWQFILDESSQRAFRDIMTVELIPGIYEKEIKKLVEDLNKVDENNNLKRDDKKIERVKILKQIQEYKVPVPIYLVNPKVSKKIINTQKPIEWLDRKYDIGLLNGGYEYNEEKGLTGKAIEIEDLTDDNII